MGFFSEIIDTVAGHHDEERLEAPADPPYVQPPWVTRWDGEMQRWVFINEQTGERSFEKPVFEEAAEALGRGEAHMEQKWDDGVEDVKEFPDRVEGGFERAGDNIEEGFDHAENRVEGGFEHAGDKIEDGWDNTVDAVEDAPENTAEWVGEEVGKVERFGDSVENFGDSMEAAYDQGRDEERYD